MSYKALVSGVILLFLFGGLLPFMLQDFSVDLITYEGYLSPVINFIQSGIQVKIPAIFGFSPTINLNPFSLFGNFQQFILNQLSGFALLPAFIGLPIILITSILLIYGVVKLFPFS